MKVYAFRVDRDNVRQFSSKENLDKFVRSLAKEAKDLDPSFKDKSIKEIIKEFQKQTFVQDV